MSIVVPAPRFNPIYRQELLTVIQNKIDEHPRSAQWKIGPSGVGGCERKIAHSLAYGAASDQEGGWAAAKGTLIHNWLEETFSTVELYMPDGTARFKTETALEPVSDVIAGGTCDLFDRLHHRVVDWKCPGDWTMQKVRSGSISEGYYIQAMIYGYHFKNMGYPVATTALMFLPQAGDDLHGDRRGSIYVEWDYDEEVAKSAIGRVERIRTLLDFAPNQQRIIEGMTMTSDFCSSCPASVMSNDRRGTCPGADMRIPTNPFG